jgi:hypothetical protein
MGGLNNEKNPKIVLYINSHDFVIHNWLESHFSNSKQSEKMPHLLSHSLNIPTTTNMNTNEEHQVELHALTYLLTYSMEQSPS